MCKKSIYKKNFLLCTIAGTLIFSYSHPTYANTSPPQISMFRASKGEEKSSNNVFVRNVFTTAVAYEGGVGIITNSILRSDSAVFSATTHGRIHAKNIIGKSNSKGLLIANGRINVEDSIITVSGHHKSSGIVFDHIIASNPKEGEKVVNQVTFNNTKLHVKNGIGILGPHYSGVVAEIHLKDSEIRADLLLKNKTEERGAQPGKLSLTADHSILEGKVKAYPQNTTIFTLNNNSTWYLKLNQFDMDKERENKLYQVEKFSHVDQQTYSVVSILNLNDSSVIFKEPHTQKKGTYQILSIGQVSETSQPQKNETPNVSAVYNATGNAEIHFNTEWSDGLSKEQQKTDRLLVRGNVSGTTTVRFNNLLKGDEAPVEGSVPSNMRGLSLVQVFGEVNENAFRLANGYTTMGGLPYKYVLNAYGPRASRGEANTEQSLLEDNENFWDFRLQSATLDRESKVKALVPQVASYLVMPNALFSAGFIDINNQNTLLDNIQTTEIGTKNRVKRGFFFSSYGSKIALSSGRNPLQYGYGANIRYAALRAGITLATLEDQNSVTSFGFLGTYGKLAFTPKDIEGAAKSILDKWSFTTFASMKHNSGMYFNALFSYGSIKGNIASSFIGNTAKLDNTGTFKASAAVGQKLETGTKGLIFEPQAQLIYQRLMLSTFSDIDGFNVNMGTPHQWLVRIGGRLTQTALPIKNGDHISFYGKFNIIRVFDKNSTIEIGDTFHLDSMGASAEGGLGVNAQLSQCLALHADVNYQHKLQKAGVSGVQLSAGMRYHF
ncbi:outer membrane autotransporter protein [Bartonella silvatica]|uniref:Outer membrane autotransporter protein n=1 Tax=Bartonella silvatica TaxID=357760 RepID=A0ABV2HH15_9HYPH